MRYRVIITARAEGELHEATARIAEQAPETAEQWFQGFRRAIRSLADFPRRCGTAPENNAFTFELRQLLYGRRRSYRALFIIRDDAVVVLSIRHTARDYLRPDDLP